MNKKQKLVLIVVVALILAAAAWLGGDALWRLMRVMHGGH